MRMTEAVRTEQPAGSLAKRTRKLRLIRISRSLRSAAHYFGALDGRLTATNSYYSQLSRTTDFGSRGGFLRLIDISRSFCSRLFQRPSWPVLIPVTPNCDEYLLIAVASRPEKCCFYKRHFSFVTPLLRSYRPFSRERVIWEDALLRSGPHWDIPGRTQSRVGPALAQPSPSRDELSTSPRPPVPQPPAPRRATLTEPGHQRTRSTFPTHRAIPCRTSTLRIRPT